MQAIRQFAVRAAANRASSGGPSGGQGASPFMKGASKGLSVISALTEFSLGRQEAAALDQQARDERLAGRAEYTTALERVNAIDAEYAQLSGAMHVAAGAMGIDSASGSIISERENLRADADRESRIINNAAHMNATLRRLRAEQLRNQAKNNRFLGVVKLGADLVSAFMPKAG